MLQGRCVCVPVFPPSTKRKGGGGGGGGGGRYNFSMRSKQIKHSNDHIKGNQVRKGGGAPWYPPLGETLVYICVNTESVSGKHMYSVKMAESVGLLSHSRGLSKENLWKF